MRLRLITSLLVAFACHTLSAQLVINEVSASNYTGFTDNYGENEDWIELYNGTGAAIDLNGYYFSDDVTDPLKFQVPSSVTIAANDYLVVFASNRNEVVGTDIHTSFKINQQQQEYAVLSDPAGTTIDLIWLDTPTQMNHSRGRVTDGANTYGVFTNPSPGAANNGAFSGYAARPVFDLASGNHAGAITLNLSTPEPNSTVRITSNGTWPTNASPDAAAPINVPATITYHAQTYSNDPMVLPSFIETNTYLIGENHTVPVMSLSGPDILTLLNGTQISPVGSFEYFGADGQLKDEAQGDFNEHGNDSWAYDQRGLDYITRDQLGYNDEIHHPIFRTKDRPSYKRLIIKAAANDNYPFSEPPGGGAHLIDAYIHSISQLADLRMDERSYEPCVMYANGQYWGMYELREKVDDFDFTDYYYDQGDGEVEMMKTWGGTWSDLPNFAPNVAPSVQNSWDDISGFILGNDMTDPANYDYVKSIYNTGSLIDYFVLNSYVVTTDWLNWNTGWWRGLDPNGDKRKWRYILWDNDASFGQYINFTGVPDTSPQADPCNPESLGDPGGQGHVPILNALLNNDEFYNDYVSRLADLSQSYFSCDYMLAHLDSLENILEPEMGRQTARWGGSVADWHDNVEVIRQFIVDRCASINDAVVDCYDVDGPHPITVQVMPPGAGWVEFNSLDLTELPWTGEYFGNLDVELEANGYGINVFSHWETNNHVFTDFNVDTTLFTFTQSDTIIAWFVTETSDIVLDVSPAGAGSIDFNNTNYATLPSTVTAPEGVDLDIEAVPAGNFFVFDHWELVNHTLVPDNLTQVAEINVDTTDIIVAYFNELDNYNVTLQVEPAGAGNIVFESAIIGSYPYNSGQLLGGDDYTLDALAEQYFFFDHWELNNDLILGDASLASNAFTLNQNDVITAVFREQENYSVTYIVEPPGTGDIRVDGSILESYPVTVKYYEPDFHRELEALPIDFYELSHWQIEHNTLSPDDISTQVSTDLMANDTIIVHYAQEQFGYYLPNAFSPNNDGINDVYFVTGHAVQKEFYSFQIFDRYGSLMFETNDISEGWNGAAREGSGHFAQDGVYVYRLKVRSVFDNELEEVMGNILLTR